MPVAYYGTWPKMGDQDSTEIAEKVASGVNARLTSGPPAGGIYHAEGPTDDGGWWVFDVWESEDAHQAFNTNILFPAMADAGLEAAAGSHSRRLDVWWDSSQMSRDAPQG